MKSKLHFNARLEDLCGFCGLNGPPEPLCGKTTNPRCSFVSTVRLRFHTARMPLAELLAIRSVPFAAVAEGEATQYESVVEGVMFFWEVSQEITS